MKTKADKPSRKQPSLLEGCYIKADQQGIRVVLENGTFKWGGRDIYDSGIFRVVSKDNSSCTLALTSDLWRKSPPKICRISRQGKRYVFAAGEVIKFKREDGLLLLDDSKTQPSVQRASPPTAGIGAQDFRSFMYRAHPEWSLWAVEAPFDSVVKAYTSQMRGVVWAQDVLETPPPRKGAKLVKLVPVVQVGAWTIGFRTVGYLMEEHIESVPNEARRLSQKLKTRAVSFMAQDVSGCGYQLFESGKSKGEMFDDSSEDFPDKVFRKLKLYIPACMLAEDAKSVRLKVEPVSKGQIAKADLVLLK